MSDIIKFEFDQPVEVALQYADARVFPSNFPGGDDRHMFTTTDGRVMYHSPLTAARIKALGVQVGERFFIVKRKNGRLTDYQVFREGAEPAAAQPRIERMPAAERARRLPELVAARNAERNGAAQSNAPSELEQKLADSIVLVQSKKDAQRAETATAQPGWADVLVNQTNVLIDCYAAALAHAGKHGNQVRPEDVRALMTTAFIGLSQRGARNAA